MPVQCVEGEKRPSVCMLYGRSSTGQSAALADIWVGSLTFRSQQLDSRSAEVAGSSPPRPPSATAMPLASFPAQCHSVVRRAPSVIALGAGQRRSGRARTAAAARRAGRLSYALFDAASNWRSSRNYRGATLSHTSSAPQFLLDQAKRRIETVQPRLNGALGAVNHRLCEGRGSVHAPSFFDGER